MATFFSSEILSTMVYWHALVSGEICAVRLNPLYTALVDFKDVLLCLPIMLLSANQCQYFWSRVPKIFPGNGSNLYFTILEV